MTSTPSTQRAGPDLGPYWIEMGYLVPGVFDTGNCSVVDIRKPLGDRDGKGFEAVFTGTYEECNAWLENPSSTRDGEAVVASPNGGE